MDRIAACEVDAIVLISQCACFFPLLDVLLLHKQASRDKRQQHALADCRDTSNAEVQN